MYDTLHQWLPVERAGSIDLPAIIPSLLSKVRFHAGEDEQLAVSGHLQNLRVTANKAGLSVKGSLCSYYHGHNLASMTRGDTQKAIERLSDELQLPMSRANITRLDIARNLFTIYPATAYLPYLGTSRYYDRLEQPESLYYQNGQRVIHFYDKIAESKRTGVSLPAICINKHLLRYELRFMKRLPQQFNQSKLTACDLYKEEFYTSLIDRWVNEFTAIRKERLTKIDFTAMRSIKDFEGQLFLLGIQAIGGETEALQLVEQAARQGVFENRAQKSRLKERIKELCQQPVLTDSSDLMQEIEEKVKRVQQYYR